MTTNELPLEKRIAAELDVDLSNPPICPEAVLNNPQPVPIHGYPPQTALLLRGFDPDDLTEDFLVDLHDLAEEHDLDLEAISVGHRDDGQ